MKTPQVPAMPGMTPLGVKPSSPASNEADEHIPVTRESMIAMAVERGNMIRSITGLLRVSNDCTLPSTEAEEIIQEAQIVLDAAKARERQ